MVISKTRKTGVRRALAAKRRRGERTGSIPYGYRLSGTGKALEPDYGEQETIDTILAMRARGQTYRAIVDWLNSHKIPVRGKEWRLNIVYRIVKRYRDGGLYDQGNGTLF